MIVRRWCGLTLAAILGCHGQTAGTQSQPPATEPAGEHSQPGKDTTADLGTVKGLRNWDHAPLRAILALNDPASLAAAIETATLADPSEPPERMDAASFMGPAEASLLPVQLVDTSGLWRLEGTYPDIWPFRIELPSPSPDALTTAVQGLLDTAELGGEADIEVQTFANGVVVRSSAGPPAGWAMTELPEPPAMHLRLEGLAGAREYLMEGMDVGLFTSGRRLTARMLERLRWAELRVALPAPDTMHARAELGGRIAGMHRGVLGRPLQGPGDLEARLPGNPTNAVIVSIGDLAALVQTSTSHPLDPAEATESSRSPDDGSTARQPLATAQKLRTLTRLIDHLGQRAALAGYFAEGSPLIVAAIELRDAQPVHALLEPLQTMVAVEASNLLADQEADVEDVTDWTPLKRPGIHGARMRIDLPEGAAVNIPLVRAVTHNDLHISLFTTSDLLVLVIGDELDWLLRALAGKHRGASLADTFTGLEVYEDLQGGCQACAISISAEHAKAAARLAVLSGTAERKRVAPLLAKLPGNGHGRITARMQDERILVQLVASGPPLGDPDAARLWRKLGKAIRGERADLLDRIF